MKWLFVQINLQHKKKAMERTKRMLVDRNIDVAIIQEPYAIGSSSPEVMGVPTGYTAYHNLTEHHPNGAAVIAKNSLRAKLCHYGRNDVAGVHYHTVITLFAFLAGIFRCPSL